MKISEVIRKLKEIQNEHGDVEVSAIENTWGDGEFVPLEDSGISFDRFNIDENIVYIGW